jgi:hypothetical protein
MNKTYLTIGALIILNMVLVSAGLIEEKVFPYLHGWLLLTVVASFAEKEEE